MHMSQIIIICQTLFSRYYLVLFLHLAFEKNTIIIPITQRGKLMALELRSRATQLTLVTEWDWNSLD